jgi:CBS domain containing-hemolysin-like protein
MIGNIALTLLFVFLNGFFVAAEFAIVKVRASQIELRAQHGSLLAGLARHILAHLDAYLSGCQLGITLASLGLGWIGEPVVATLVADVSHAAGVSLDPATLHSVSIAIAFSLITVLHIVLGEQAPKTWAIRNAEAVTLAVAIPLRIFHLLFRPIIAALNWMSNTLLRSLGIQPSSEHETHSAQELRYLIQESGRQGALEVSERELIENVFEFTETTASQVMVPRSRIVGVDVSTPVPELLDRVMDEGYSRLPVYATSIDTIVGILYAKDLLTMMHHTDLIILQDILHPAYMVPEDIHLKKLLREMQSRRVHMAIVLDEFGGTAGLVTLEDIVEEIVGNIQDEYDDEAPAVAATTPDVFDLIASVHIDEANEILPVPLPESDEYETVGGLINARAGRIPATGDVVMIEPYECEIISSTPRRVERVRLRRISSGTSE